MSNHIRQAFAAAGTGQSSSRPVINNEEL